MVLRILFNLNLIELQRCGFELAEGIDQIVEGTPRLVVARFVQVDVMVYKAHRVHLKKVEFTKERA